MPLEFKFDMVDGFSSKVGALKSAFDSSMSQAYSSSIPPVLFGKKVVEWMQEHMTHSRVLALWDPDTKETWVVSIPMYFFENALDSDNPISRLEHLLLANWVQSMTGANSEMSFVIYAGGPLHGESRVHKSHMHEMYLNVQDKPMSVKSYKDMDPNTVVKVTTVKYTFHPFHLTDKVRFKVALAPELTISDLPPSDIERFLGELFLATKKS